MSTRKSRNVEQKIGARLQAFRREKSYSIRRLSEITGIAASTLSEIETEKYEPGAQKLQDLVRKTDLNALWLLTGEGEMLRSAIQAQAAPVSEEERALADLLSEGQSCPGVR